jgi:hypothetical protein
MHVPDARSAWREQPTGIADSDQRRVIYPRREWDLSSEKFIGMHFAQLAPVLLKESRFHPDFFKPSQGSNRFIGGIIFATFKLFEPNPHEVPGQVRSTATIKDDFWVSVELDPEGEIVHYNPLADTGASRKGLAVGLGSRVYLNNLSSPGTWLEMAHFPMFDIIKPPTSENVARIITEIKKRCGLEKFFVLRSSDHGMMVIAPELVDEPHMRAVWDGAETINHPEVDGQDIWFDSRWHARNKQNFKKDLGLPNGSQVCGILRVNAAPPLKPELPIVIAASF